MNPAVPLALAFALDLILGDPRVLPHPVRVIGGCATWLEPRLRARLPARLAGVLFTLVIVGGTMLAMAALVYGATALDPRLGMVVTVVAFTLGLATGDLGAHAHAVQRALQARDLPLARKRVSRMVGRDTDNMKEVDITRATVESVAENLVDGVTGPLFFALLLGPVGLWGYKAASTLDSMVGHRTDRYRVFGWASARLDDLLNWVPARLTAPLLILVGMPLGRPAQACVTLARDGHRTASPNAGLPEAAMAGVLGVQLGGPARYQGVLHDTPTLGTGTVPLRPGHIRTAVNLMVVTAACFLLLGVIVRGTIA